MTGNKNIFVKKKILIYGLGKSGLSSYFFLKKNNDVYLYDDRKNIIKNKKIKKQLIKSNYFNKIKVDFILVIPGINIKKCQLKDFLNKIIFFFEFLWMLYQYFVKLKFHYLN